MIELADLSRIFFFNLDRFKMTGLTVSPENRLVVFATGEAELDKDCCVKLEL